MREDKDMRKTITIRKFPLLYFILSMVFIAALVAVLFISLFNNQNSAVALSPLWLCLYTLLGAGVLFVVSQFLTMLPEPGAKLEGIIFCVLFVLIAALQMYVMLNFLGDVDVSSYGAQPFRLAVQHVSERKAPGDYFIFHPEQIGAYTIWNLFIFIIEAFGVEEYTFFGILINIVAIDLALFILYRCVRSVLGSLRALIGFFMCILTLPFLIYAPIFCAEILVLPFAAAMIFLWAKARRAWRNEEYDAVYFSFFSMCLIGVLGALIHVAVLLLWLVIAIDFLFLLRGPARKAIVFGLGLVVTIGLFLGGSLYLRSSPLLSDHNYSGNMVPLKYYMVAAWTPDEKEGQEYLQEIMSEEGQAAKNAKADELFDEVFGNKTVDEKFGFFLDRLGMLFGDGMQNAQNNYAENEKDKTIFAFLTNKNSQVYSISAYFAFAFWGATMLWAIVGSVLSTIRRNNYFGFVRAFIFVYTIYMILFSPSSSAMLLVLPLFIVLMIEPLAPKPSSHLAPATVNPTENLTEGGETESLAFYGVDEDSSTSLLLSDKDYSARSLRDLSDTSWMRAIEGESLLNGEKQPQEIISAEEQIPFVSSYKQPSATAGQARGQQELYGEPQAQQPYPPQRQQELYGEQQAQQPYPPPRQQELYGEPQAQQPYPPPRQQGLYGEPQAQQPYPPPRQQELYGGPQAQQLFTVQRQQELYGGSHVQQTYSSQRQQELYGEPQAQQPYSPQSAKQYGSEDMQSDRLDFRGGYIGELPLTNQPGGRAEQYPLQEGYPLAGGLQFTQRTSTEAAPPMRQNPGQQNRYNPSTGGYNPRNAAQDASQQYPPHYQQTQPPAPERARRAAPEQTETNSGHNRGGAPQAGNAPYVPPQYRQRQSADYPSQSTEPDKRRRRPVPPSKKDDKGY